MTLISPRQLTLLLGLVGLLGCSPGSLSPALYYTRRAGDPTMTAGSLVTPRNGHTATDLGGSILVTGGATTTAPATDEAELVDPASGVSSPLDAFMLQPRRGHAAARVAGGVVLFGGADGTGQRLDSLERYDEAARAFTPLPERLSEPRADAALAMVGDRLVLAGGGAGTRDTLEVWSLDPLRRTATLPLPGASRRDVQLVHAGGSLLLLHGIGGPTAWIDIDSGQVSPLTGPELVVGGTAFNAPFLPGAVLIAGGLSPYTQKLERGFQLLRPGKAPRPADFGPIQYRARPVVVSGTASVYLFAGELGNLPVALSERLRAGGGQLVPDTFGAVIGMRATYLGPDHIVLSGGLGPDGRPSALISVLSPAGGARDGDAFAEASAARDRSAQVDADLARVRGERDALFAQVDQANLDVASARALLRAEQNLAQVLRDGIGQATADAAALRQQIDALQNQQPALQSQLDDLRRREASLRSELAQVQDVIARLRAQL